MKRIGVLAGLVGGGIFAAVAAIHLCGEINVVPFHIALRGNFFTGFLTLGGFLFSLKTFIVVNMKKELYDDEEYRRHHAELRVKTSLFTPLKRLTQLLFLSIVAALATSVFQITVGLLNKWWTVAFCLAAIATTLVLLSCSLFQIKSNLDSWLNYVDDKARKVRERQPT